jgi:hypothetical protein
MIFDWLKLEIVDVDVVHELAFHSAIRARRGSVMRDPLIRYTFLTRSAIQQPTSPEARQYKQDKNHIRKPLATTNAKMKKRVAG